MAFVERRDCEQPTRKWTIVGTKHHVNPSAGDAFVARARRGQFGKLDRLPCSRIEVEDDVIRGRAGPSFLRLSERKDVTGVGREAPWRAIDCVGGGI
jgi:hypothetical protein